jgi:hypothetical protein
MTGVATITAPAARSVRSDECWPWKNASPSGAVRRFSLETMTRARRNSFQVHMKTSTIIVRIAGLPNGTSTRQSVVQLDAPSIRAASISEAGAARKKARIQNVPNATESATCGRMSAQYVSVSPRLRRS